MTKYFTCKKIFKGQGAKRAEWCLGCGAKKGCAIGAILDGDETLIRRFCEEQIMVTNSPYNGELRRLKTQGRMSKIDEERKIVQKIATEIGFVEAVKKHRQQRTKEDVGNVNLSVDVVTPTPVDNVVSITSSLSTNLPSVSSDVSSASSPPSSNASIAINATYTSYEERLNSYGTSPATQRRLSNKNTSASTASSTSSSSSSQRPRRDNSFMYTDFILTSDREAKKKCVKRLRNDNTDTLAASVPPSLLSTQDYESDETGFDDYDNDVVDDDVDDVTISLRKRTPAIKRSGISPLSKKVRSVPTSPAVSLKPQLISVSSTRSAGTSPALMYDYDNSANGLSLAALIKAEESLEPRKLNFAEMNELKEGQQVLEHFMQRVMMEASRTKENSMNGNGHSSDSNSGSDHTLLNSMGNGVESSPASSASPSVCRAKRSASFRKRRDEDDSNLSTDNSNSGNNSDSNNNNNHINNNPHSSHVLVFPSQQILTSES